MKEVKTPKRPLIYYYAVALIVLSVLNFLVMPWLAEKQVKEVDYGTFMTMPEKGEIGKVEVEENQIVFTNKENTKIYKTGIMNDPGLIDRLHASGAEFSGEIVEQMSPFVSALLTWVLPGVIFIVLGQFMAKKLMDKAGGGAASMMFGKGDSGAKVYVQSTEGISFSDVAGEDEAKESLQEIVNYLHDPSK